MKKQIVFMMSLVLVASAIQSCALAATGDQAIRSPNAGVKSVSSDSPITVGNANSYLGIYSNYASGNNYTVYFRNNSNQANSIRFETNGYYFIYDISGSTLQWKATAAQPAAWDTLGSGATSNSIDTQVNSSGSTVLYQNAFYKTNVTYQLSKNMVKENFILYGLPSIKNYLYLEYSGNIQFNKTLNICAEGQCFTPSGNTDDFNTSGQINFTDNKGNVIFYLQAPIITDKDGKTTKGLYIVHGSNAQMNFWLRIPTSFLQNATYPIFIDPTIITVNQDTKVVNYNSDWFDMNVSLQKLSGNLSDVNNIYIFSKSESDFKFGAIDAENNDSRVYVYQVKSSIPLNQIESYVYSISHPRTKVLSEQYFLNFYDICTNLKTVTPYLNFTPNCNISFSGDRKNLNVTFLSNSTIDPEFLGSGVVNVSGSSDCNEFISNAEVLGYGRNCTSLWSGSNCTSINVSVNITTFSSLSMVNCEIMFNETGNCGKTMTITPQSSLSMEHSLISTNTTALNTNVWAQSLPFGLSSNVNFQNSRFTNLGCFQEVNGQRGLELNTTSITINNITLQRGSGLAFLNNSNGASASFINVSYTSGGVWSNALSLSLTNVTIIGSGGYPFTAYYAGSGTFNNFTFVNNSYGILMQTSSNNVFKNFYSFNTYYATTVSYGVYAQYGSKNNYFNNSQIWSAPTPIYTDSTSSNQTFYNINIWNCTKAAGANQDCLVLVGGNNSFIKGIINYTTKYIANIQSDGNMFQDMILRNDTILPVGTAAGFYFYSNSRTQTTFLNSTITNAPVTFQGTGSQDLIRQWYVDLFTVVNGTGLSGVNMSVWNGTGSLFYSGLSNSTGWIANRLNVTQYINRSGTILGWKNYTIYSNLSLALNASLSWAIGNGSTGTYTVGTDPTIYGSYKGNSTRFRLDLILDTQKPTVIVLSPANLTYSNISIFFNLSVNDSSGVSNCYMVINDGVFSINMQNFTGTAWNYTKFGFTDGFYTAEFVCNDTNNNINNTEIIAFAIDTTPPVITNVVPNATSYEVNTQPSPSVLYANATDTNPVSAVLTFNGNNQTATFDNSSGYWKATVPVMGIGSYNFRWWFFDAANNSKFSDNYIYTVFLAPTSGGEGSGFSGGAGAGISEIISQGNISVKLDYQNHYETNLVKTIETDVFAESLSGSNVTLTIVAANPELGMSFPDSLFIEPNRTYKIPLFLPADTEGMVMHNFSFIFSAGGSSITKNVSITVWASPNYLFISFSSFVMTYKIPIAVIIILIIIAAIIIRRRK